MSHASLPKRVTLELTNACTRKCDMCPRLKTSMNIGYMNPHLFTRIINQLPRGTVVVPFLRGESLMHPQFAELLYTAQGFREVQLASNGDLLNTQNQMAIRDVCSLFSLSLHEYQLPNANEHLEFLHDLENVVTRQVSILEPLLPPTRKQHFIDEWLLHADRVRVYKQHSHVGYGDTLLAVEDRGEPCKMPYSDMAVYWNGKVALCCQDWNSHMSLGNLNHLTIKEAWNSPNYREVRNLHSTGKRRQVPSCANCHQWLTQPEGCLGDTYTRKSAQKNACLVKPGV